jgi:hypothetical protein
MGSTFVDLDQVDVALEHYRLALRGFDHVNSPRDVEDVLDLIESVSNQAGQHSGT